MRLLENILHKARVQVRNATLHSIKVDVRVQIWDNVFGPVSEVLDNITPKLRSVHN